MVGGMREKQGGEEAWKTNRPHVSSNIDLRDHYARQGKVSTPKRTLFESMFSAERNTALRRRMFTYRLRGNLSRPAAAATNVILGLVCLFAIVRYLCLPIKEREKILALACQPFIDS